MEALRQAESVGQHEAARRLGVPVATLGNWCPNHRSGNTDTATGLAARTPVSSRRPVNDLEAEVSRLRKELASAKLDIEILR